MNNKLRPTYETYALVTFETPEEAYRMYRADLNYKGTKLVVEIADYWHQPVTNPDGIMNCKPSTEEETHEEETEGNGNDESEDKEAWVVQNAPILNLNEDCFLLIIEFIPFNQKHVLSNVCRHWRNMMTGYWSRFTELNFQREPLCWTHYSDRNLELYLRLCPNITSVYLNQDAVFGDLNELPTSKSIMKAATLCPQMKELTIEGIHLAWRSLAYVAHFCENLTSITITSCKFDEVNKTLTVILKKCLNLKELKFRNCELKPGNWLQILPERLKHFSLYDCSIDISYLNKGLAKLTENLEVLELIFYRTTNPLDLKQLKSFRSLHSITYVSPSATNHIVCRDMFRNLKHLNLELNSFLTDDLLKGIVEYSSGLTTLNISSVTSSKMTTMGYKAIAGLKELVKLDISKNTIENEVLIELAEHCHKLEVLYFDYCSCITDEGCKRVVQKLMNLQELHIDSCLQVTNETIYAAVEAATQNHKKAKLTLFDCDTSIKGFVEHPHPLVLLHSKMRLHNIFDDIHISHDDFSFSNDDYCFSDDDYYAFNVHDIDSDYACSD